MLLHTSFFEKLVLIIILRTDSLINILSTYAINTGLVTSCVSYRVSFYALHLIADKFTRIFCALCFITVSTTSPETLYSPKDHLSPSDCGCALSPRSMQRCLTTISFSPSISRFQNVCGPSLSVAVSYFSELPIFI